MTALTWMESALCTDPLWRDRSTPTQRAVCAGCPVSAQCLSRALETIRALTPTPQARQAGPRQGLRQPRPLLPSRPRHARGGPLRQLPVCPMPARGHRRKEEGRNYHDPQ